MTAHVKVGDTVVTRMRLLGRQAEGQGVDLGIPYVEKVFNGQSGAFINMEVNTSLDLIRVRVARHQEPTVDARTRASMVVEQASKEEEARPRAPRPSPHKHRVAKTDGMGLSSSGGVDRKAIQARYEAFLGRLREKQTQERLEEQKRMSRQGSSLLGSSSSSESTAVGAEAAPADLDHADTARRNLLEQMAKSGPAKEEEEDALSASEGMAPADALVAEMNRELAERRERRRALAGLEPSVPGDGWGGEASTAGASTSARTREERRREAVEAYVTLTKNMAQGEMGARGRSAPQPRAGSPAKEAPADGVAVPRLCACPWGVAADSGPEAVRHCCTNCPLYQRPDEYDRLRATFVRSKREAQSKRQPFQ